MVVAANLGDARESDTTPAARRWRWAGTRWRRPIRPPGAAASASGALALWLALALLLVEWVSYHRRWTT